VKPKFSPRIFDYTRLAFWVGLIVTMYVCAALINLSAKNTALRDKADRIEEDTIKVQNEVDVLQAQISYFKTDEYKERLAREKLGLQAPGEQVVIVGRGDIAQGRATALDGQADIRLPQRSHLEEWLDFLFGNVSSS